MSAPKQAPLVSGISNRRILLVDDNHAIHDDYRKILVGEQRSAELDDLSATLFGDASGPRLSQTITFETDSAHQGEEGLEAVRRACAEGRPYAMAFIDMRMPPGWDGLETIKRIWEVDPNIQIVICSAYSDHSWQELVDSLPSAGQWLLLRKPFDSVEVSQMALALTIKWDLEQKSTSTIEHLQTKLRESEKLSAPATSPC